MKQKLTMKNVMLNCCIVTILICQVIGKLNIVVHKFSLCNDTLGYFPYIGNITVVNNVIRDTFSWDVKLPLDDRIGVSLLAESRLISKRYIKVLSIREKNLCKTATALIGETWFQLQKAVDLPPGVCPMPARNYTVKNFIIDVNDIPVANTLPYGTVRVTINVIDNLDKKKLMSCFSLEIENARN